MERKINDIIFKYEFREQLTLTEFFVDYEKSETRTTNDIVIMKSNFYREHSWKFFFQDLEWIERGR